MREFSPGEKHAVRLTGLAMGGESVGRLDDMAVFVPNGVPGDIAEIRLNEVKKNYARGDINRMIKNSPHRVKPPCPIFYQCGGCQLQHMTYGAQILYKSRMTQDTLRHLGGQKDFRVEEMIEAEDPWNYRNKMQIVASTKPYLHSKKKSPFFGLYAKKTHSVIKMDECLIQHPLTNKILGVFKEAVTKLQWQIYDEKTHQGLLRHFLTRVSSSSNEILLIPVVTSDKIPNIREFVQILTRKMPELRGIVLNVNPKKTNVVLGPNSKTIWGEDHLIEEIGDIKYRISPTSFFQVNPYQAKNLFMVLDEFLEPGGKDIILDAFCGMGAISLWLAKKARTVVGIEEIPQAKKDALASAEMNGIGNLEFHTGRVEKILPEIYHKGYRIDKVVLDPPRKGCEKSVLDLLAKMRVNNLVYVSCNPSTLARDIAILQENGYMLEKVVPLDMFPQTYHVECIAMLRYRTGEIKRVSTLTAIRENLHKTVDRAVESARLKTGRGGDMAIILKARDTAEMDTATENDNINTQLQINEEPEELPENDRVE